MNPGTTQASAADPRRSPRVAACCAVEIRTGGAIWTGATEDVGPGGCLLFTRHLPATGGELLLSLASDLVEGPLVALGRIAWARRAAVTRAGIAFSGTAVDARRSPVEWFRRLASSLPLEIRTRAVSRPLGLDTRLFLGNPPASHAGLGADELRLLRRIASGTTVGALVAAEGEALLFRVLGRGIVSRQPASPGAAARWSRLFEEAEAHASAESAAERPAATPPPRAAIDLAGAAPALRDRSPEPAPRAPRAHDVQRLYEAGVARLYAGDAQGAESLIRRALALAPDDRVLQRLVVQRFGRW